jgi:hypothetical protein
MRRKILKIIPFQASFSRRRDQISIVSTTEAQFGAFVGHSFCMIEMIAPPMSGLK